MFFALVHGERDELRLAGVGDREPEHHGPFEAVQGEAFVDEDDVGGR